MMHHRENDNGGDNDNVYTASIILFNFTGFAEKYGLVHLATNYFIAQNENNVPTTTVPTTVPTTTAPTTTTTTTATTATIPTTTVPTPATTTTVPTTTALPTAVPKINDGNKIGVQLGIYACMWMIIYILY